MWTWAHRAVLISLAGVLAFGTFAGPSPGDEKVARLRASEAVVVEATEPAHRALAAWAVRRFARAGLRLPPVVIEFAPDAQACGGNTAVAVHGGACARIVICTTSPAEVVVRKALLHELAHVWAADALQPATRSAFLEHRGLASWTDGCWSDRGSEHAAEIVTWALMDRELVMVTLEDHEPPDLAAGYRILTGNPPPFRGVGSV